MEDGQSIYFAGDTCVFGDMALIARLYEPTVAVLPIGGHFTMDPTEAALALELLGNPRCVPSHYGTFGLLAGHARRAARARAGRGRGRSRARRDRGAVRERWFGSTGRRVPEIAVDGELDVEGALVLDGVGDAEALRAAHEAGQPVVRAGREPRGGARGAGPARGVVGARPGRPARSCWSLDLTDLTYG